MTALVIKHGSDVPDTKLQVLFRDTLLLTPQASKSLKATAGAMRGDNGYRHYAEGAIERLRFIRISQNLGFTLDAIRGMLAETGECSYNKAFAEVSVRIQEIELLQASLAEQHQNLRKLHAVLAHGLATGEQLPCDLS